MRACDEVEPHLGGEWIREERARRIEHSKECAESYLLDKGTLPKRAVMCQERKLRRHGLTGCCLFKSIARRVMNARGSSRFVSSNVCCLKWSLVLQSLN